MAGEFVLVAVLLLLGMGAYWSFIIFPRQRDFANRQKLVSTLHAGDEVVTYGGIIGTVRQVEAEQGIVHVEIADGVVVRLLAAAVVQAYNAEEIASSARKALGTAKTIPS